MIWQDAVLTLGGFILAVSLLPMLRKSIPAPPLSSSLPVAFVLWMYVLAVGTLGLTASAISIGLQAAIWTWLAGKGLYK